MKNIFKKAILFLLVLSGTAWAGYIINPYTGKFDAIQTISDGVTDYPAQCKTLEFSTVTDNGDGSCTVSSGGVGTIDGTGTTNYIPKWSDADTLTNSIIFNVGNNVGIGSSNPRGVLDIVNTDSPNRDVYLGVGGTFNNPTSEVDLYVKGHLEVDGGLTGGPVPGGSNFNVTFNDNGGFGGDDGFVYRSGAIGIGTTLPNGILDVRTDHVRIWTGVGSNAQALSAGELYVEGDLEVDGTIYGDASGLTNLPAASGWTDGGTNVYVTTTTDNVGIGTITPQSPVHILRSNGGTPSLLSLHNPEITNDNGINLDFRGDSSGAGATAFKEAGGLRMVMVEHDNATWKSKINFRTAASGAAGTKMTLTEKGYLIINSNSAIAATAALHVTNIGTDDSFLVEDVVNVDSTPFVIKTDGNVGIGTLVPDVLLNVGTGGAKTSVGSGDVYIQNDLEVDGTVYMSSCSGAGCSGATGWTDDGTNVYVTTTTDNVGIGTTQPTGRLDVRGDELRIWTGAGSNAQALASGELYVQGDLEVDGTIYGDGSQLTGISAASGWTDGGTNVYVTTTTDNVGIGTTQPIGKMQIVGSGNVGIGSTNPGGKLVVNGEIKTVGTAPTIGTCGTSPAIGAGSTDFSGFMTIGTGGIATSCAITFAVTKTKAPSCFCNHQGAVLYTRGVATTTTLTCDAATPLTASGRMDYICGMNE